MQRKEREIVLKFAPYPYLIVAGKEDPIMSIKQNRSEAKLGNDGEIVVFADSVHIIPMEKAFELNKVILEFLRRKA